jgi:hypothetical protein
MGARGFDLSFPPPTTIPVTVPSDDLLVLRAVTKLVNNAGLFYQRFLKNLQNIAELSSNIDSVALGMTCSCLPLFLTLEAERLKPHVGQCLA